MRSDCVAWASECGRGDPVSVLIWIAAAYVVGTKLLDCWTTQRFVQTAAAESNALASCLMRRFGFTRTVWGIFAFASLWAVALAASADASGAAAAAWGYALLAAFVGTVQAAVAATNATGRFNAITRVVYRLHTRRKRRG